MGRTIFFYFAKKISHFFGDVTHLLGLYAFHTAPAWITKHTRRRRISYPLERICECCFAGGVILNTSKPTILEPASSFRPPRDTYPHHATELRFEEKEVVELWNFRDIYIRHCHILTSTNLPKIYKVVQYLGMYSNRSVQYWVFWGKMPARSSQGIFRERELAEEYVICHIFMVEIAEEEEVGTRTTKQLFGNLPFIVPKTPLSQKRCQLDDKKKRYQRTEWRNRLGNVGNKYSFGERANPNTLPSDHTYYCTGLLILDHSYLVGNLTNSKIAGTKASEPLKSWHFCMSNFRTC